MAILFTISGSNSRNFILTISRFTKFYLNNNNKQFELVCVIKSEVDKMTEPAKLVAKRLS